jgi:environmental stress-induced protein Ves
LVAVVQQIVHLEDVAPQLWRNGGGQTRELLTWPGGGDWRLRISLADIRSDGPFSAFPGVTRWFTVVHGRGVVLRFGSHKETLGAGAAPLRFDGAAAPDCALIDGPTRDLNLMLRSGEGVMQPARPGQPWEGGFAQRGLFTAVSGTLRSESGTSLQLPANTLAWQSDAAAGALRFEPDEPTPEPVAWWLGYSP